MGNEMNLDCEIRTVTETKRTKKDGVVKSARLVARDKEGLVELIIKSPNGFEGFTPEQVIQVKIVNTQKTLEHFQ